MKKLKSGIYVFVLVVLIIVFWFEKQPQKKLRAENDSLQQQLAQLQTDNENFSNQLAQTKNSQSLADDKMSELLKLRGEVGMLRNQLGQAQKAAAQNQFAIAKTQQTQANPISSADQFELQRIHIQNALKQISLAARIYAGDNNDRPATNFDELIQDKLITQTEATNFAGGISINDFEFINVGLVNFDMPQMIMFRERIPRVDPNGEWERIYGLADGTVQTVWGRDSKQFDDFEKRHSPPNPTVSPSQ